MKKTLIILLLILAFGRLFGQPVVPPQTYDQKFRNLLLTSGLSIGSGSTALIFPGVWSSVLLKKDTTTTLCTKKNLRDALAGYSSADSAKFLTLYHAWQLYQPKGSYVKGTPWTAMGYVTGTPWTGMGYVTGTPWTSMGYVTGTPWASMGYLTSYTETDPTVPSWAKAISKPSYTWSEVSGKPTALSSFTNDLGNYGGFVTGTPWMSAGYLTDSALKIETRYHAAATFQPKGSYVTGTPWTAMGYITGTPWTGMGYLTSYTETDPTVSAWAKAGTKPSYIFSEIGTKPTTLSGYGITDGALLTEKKPLYGCGVDTTACNTTQKYLMGYSQGFVIDTIIYILQRVAGTPNITPKVFFGSDITATGTATVTSPSAVTSYTTATKVSAFDNASVPAGSMVWLMLPTISVKPKSIHVVLIGHKL